jgi:hypothetical protein
LVTVFSLFDDWNHVALPKRIRPIFETSGRAGTILYRSSRSNEAEQMLRLLRSAVHNGSVATWNLFQESAVFRSVDESEAIRKINELGDRARTSWKAVRWPHVDLHPANLERIAEAVVDSRVDTTVLAFGEEFDADDTTDEIVEAWRTDEFQTRFAPEGIFACVRFTIRLTVSDPEAGNELIAEETLVIKAEFCLSFSEKHHTRPFIDFMEGEVRRVGDGATTIIDPFSMFIEPDDAVAWGLNGPEETGGSS